VAVEQPSLGPATVQDDHEYAEHNQLHCSVVQRFWYEDGLFQIVAVVLLLFAIAHAVAFQMHHGTMQKHPSIVL
jgi:hypothetical protein